MMSLTCSAPVIERYLTDQAKVTKITDEAVGRVLREGKRVA